MVNKSKKKIILILLMILLFLMTVLIIVLNQTGIINRIIENNNKEEIKKEISYEVYKHVNGKTAMLVIAEDTENGIEKIIRADNGLEIYCNGKTKVAYDYEVDITGKESITFKMVNTLREEIEKTIQINDQFYLDMIDYSLTKETETQKALTVNYKEGSTVKQYRIGEGENWTNYTNSIRLDDYQILEALENENRKVNISLRQVDNIGNEIIVESKLNYTIPDTVVYKQEDKIIEGESILSCVANNNLETGNYIFKVTGTANGTTKETIQYPVELYNYDGNSEYIANDIAVIPKTTYTGVGKIDLEKRMLILKYNGDLTINEGVTITPTGTSEEINGSTYLCTKKGMFIYCAGTLTNNGEITMTAKGTVNQEGENVYLYKNEDDTYEYVPAVGAEGGTSASHWGNSGGYGISRRTGGGGSGSSNDWRGRSGLGGSGTSYSGGVGSGGAGSGWSANASSIGGSGGNGQSDGNNSWSGGGGAGNPGGITYHEGWNGGSGTGGLLLIYGNKIINNGIFSTNGVTGGTGHTAGGGGSGRWKYKYIL